MPNQNPAIGQIGDEEGGATLTSIPEKPVGAKRILETVGLAERCTKDLSGVSVKFDRAWPRC